MKIQHDGHSEPINEKYEPGDLFVCISDCNLISNINMSLNAIKSGTTCIIDAGMHHSKNFVRVITNGRKGIVLKRKFVHV